MHGRRLADPAGGAAKRNGGPAPFERRTPPAAWTHAADAHYAEPRKSLADAGVVLHQERQREHASPLLPFRVGLLGLACQTERHAKPGILVREEDVEPLARD